MAGKMKYLCLVSCSGSARQRRKAAAVFVKEGAEAKDCGGLIRIASAEPIDEGRVRGVLAACGDITEIRNFEYVATEENFEHRQPDGDEFRALTGKPRRIAIFLMILIALVGAALITGLYLLGVFGSTRAVLITAGITAAVLILGDVIALLLIKKAEGRPTDWFVYDGIITDSSTEDVLGRDGNYNRNARFEEFAQGDRVLAGRHISKKKHAVGAEVMLCVNPAKNTVCYLNHRKKK